MKILIALLFCVPLFAQNTDKDTIYLSSDEVLYNSYEATPNALRMVNVGVDTIYYSVPDTAVNKKLTYGDSILQVRHTNPYFFFQFTIYDSLTATSGTLTDSLVFERYNDFSLTWETISVVRQSDQVPVSVLVPGSGVTRTYLVRLPYPSYETTLRIRRTNVNDIVGRDTWVSIKAIGN